MKDQTSYRLTRRGFLHHGSAAAAAGLLGRWPRLDLRSRSFTAARASGPHFGESHIDGTFVDPSLVQRLAMRAVDAAKSAV